MAANTVLLFFALSLLCLAAVFRMAETASLAHKPDNASEQSQSPDPITLIPNYTAHLDQLINRTKQKDFSGLRSESMIQKPGSTDTVVASGEDGAEHEEGHAEKEHHGIHVASWNWEYVEAPFIYTLFVVIAGMCKVGFHHAQFLESLLPESCLMILLGTAVGGIVYAAGGTTTVPSFEPKPFFLFLLPPIMLESAYSLHDRAFAENIGTILLYAVAGTLINCFLIGPTLYMAASFGLMGGYFSLPLVEALVFSALISAVDPVAVLAIFQEVGVNKDLYFLVFGESLLNDAVTVVLYNTMVTFNSMEQITMDQVGLGIAAFFTVSLGGLTIGALFGIVTALITKHTEEVRVVEPLAMLGMAYLSYLTAEMVHFSGIISIIGCGLVQVQYAKSNISPKSYTTVKYFCKMLSATCDSIIFLFLGMVLVNEDHVWHTGFIAWTVILCLLYRFCSVFFLTFFANHVVRSKKIGPEEQFIMAYGGLRGAICFSLVVMLNGEVIERRNLFITATLVMVIFTVFIQGGTIKPLVACLNVRRHKTEEKTLSSEINSTLITHIMTGIEEITGKHGDFYLKNIVDYYDEKFLKFWLSKHRDDVHSIFKTYEKIAIEDHYAHLYGPAAVMEEKHHIPSYDQNESDEARNNAKAVAANQTVLPVDVPAQQQINRNQIPPSPTPRCPIRPRSLALFSKSGSAPAMGRSAVASELLALGNAVASPVMMDSVKVIEDLKKAFNQNPYVKYHRKFNPNLINDEEHEIAVQLRQRRMRAKRITIAALSSQANSQQSSIVDLNLESFDEGGALAEDDMMSGPVVNRRPRSEFIKTRSDSATTTPTEMLIERANRRRQNMAMMHGKAQTFDGGAGGDTALNSSRPLSVVSGRSSPRSRKITPPISVQNSMDSLRRQGSVAGSEDNRISLEPVPEMTDIPEGDSSFSSPSSACGVGKIVIGNGKTPVGHPPVKERTDASPTVDEDDEEDVFDDLNPKTPFLPKNGSESIAIVSGSKVKHRLLKGKQVISDDESSSDHTKESMV